MDFVFAAVSVFCLLSLGQTAPVSDCQNRLRQIEIRGRDQLLGKWFNIGESNNIPGSKTLTKLFVETSWINATAGTQPDTIIIFQNQKMFGQCATAKHSLTLEGNTVSMSQPLRSSTMYLATACPDCTVLYSNYTTGAGSYKGLQLQSRRNEISAAELEDFAKQLECLGLPPATHLDPKKGFCQQSSSMITDLTGDSAEDEVSKMLANISKFEESLKTLVDMFS